MKNLRNEFFVRPRFRTRPSVRRPAAPLASGKTGSFGFESRNVGTQNGLAISGRAGRFHEHFFHGVFHEGDNQWPADRTVMREAEAIPQFVGPCGIADFGPHLILECSENRATVPCEVPPVQEILQRGHFRRNRCLREIAPARPWSVPRSQDAVLRFSILTSTCSGLGCVMLAPLFPVRKVGGT